MPGRIAEVVHGGLLGIYAHSSIVILSGSQSWCDGTVQREDIVPWRGEIVSLSQIIQIRAYHVAKCSCNTMVAGMVISLRTTIDNTPTTRDKKKKKRGIALLYYEHCNKNIQKVQKKLSEDVSTSTCLAYRKSLKGHGEAGQGPKPLRQRTGPVGDSMQQRFDL